MAGLGADPWRRGAGKLFAAVTVLACVSWDLASGAQRPEEAAPMAGNLGAPAALVEGGGGRGWKQGCTAVLVSLAGSRKKQRT